MRLVYTEIRATYRALTSFRLPEHSGSLLRGVLGRALRRASCVAPDACVAACLHPDRCAYARLFAPPVPEPPPHRFLRGTTRVPQPLVPIFPPPGALRIEAGDTFAFGLRLLGAWEASNAQRIHEAFERIPDLPLGPDGGRVELEAVTQIAARDRVLDVRAGDAGEGRVEVRIETPLWIEQGGKPIAPGALDFPVLFRSVYRRLTVLAALYGVPDPEDDRTFTEIDARAGEVRAVARELRALRWERRSDETGTTHGMTGIVGAVAFEGPVGVFRPILRAAAIVHAGKETSFGLGRLAIAGV